MSGPRIAVFRALQLGDMLCLVPALRALRAAHPQAGITLIGLPWAADFARRFGRYIDHFEIFPGMAGFPEQAANEAAHPAFVAAMRARRFELVLQMHGNGQLSNPLLQAFGAARVAGFHPPQQPPPDAASFIAWDETRNEVLRFLDLLQWLGMPADGEHLEFPLKQQDFDELKAAAPSLAPAGEYVCIHPGARFASRRWPLERFAALARLASQQGLQVVLTGSAAEAALCAQLAGLVNGPVLNLVGRTSLGALAALVAGTRLVVCNDTGMSHVAAALSTPSVVISSGGDAQRWSPLDSVRHRVLWVQMACRPCMYVDCPLPGHPCATAVTVAEVWREAQRMLDIMPQGSLGLTVKENA